MANARRSIYCRRFNKPQRMKVTITSIELKSPFHFFKLSYQALKIIQQLKSTNYVEKKTVGFWTKHYTMTLWKEESDLKQFAKTGSHLDAMKKGSSIAKEIRTFTYDADKLPGWKEAKEMLRERGKAVRY